MGRPIGSAGSDHVSRELYDAAVGEAEMYKALYIGVLEQFKSICNTKLAEVRPREASGQAYVNEVAPGADIRGNSGWQLTEINEPAYCSIVLDVLRECNIDQGVHVNDVSTDGGE